MSEHEREQTAADEATVAHDPASESKTTDPGSRQSGKLSELMATGAAPPGQRRPDLDAEALRAAQTAIAEGERALAAARAQLARQGRQPAGARRRELLLRVLLVLNVVAMIVVVLLPLRQVGRPQTEAPTGGTPPIAQPQPAPPAAPRLADKYNQALLASDGGDYAGAIALLNEYLAESPRMPASRLVNVYRQMAHYAGAIGRFREAQEYERKAQAVTRSHSLPDDLVAMARAAVDSGDQESLRQIWARFLLQQRQIPSSLYQHVAEAYLQLGDSYRQQANAAAEQARLEELEKTEALLREQAEAQGRGR